MHRLISFTGFLITMFISMSFMDYPSTIVSYDHDFHYWVYKNKVKKFIWSSERNHWQDDLKYYTEHFFSKEGDLVEERSYIEFGAFVLTDTIPLINDGKRFYGNWGVSYKRYLSNEKIIMHQQSFDKNGNLMFSVFKNDNSYDETLLQAKILTQSIKYSTDNRDIEISSFNFREFKAVYFDTLVYVKLTKDLSTNTISVSSWRKYATALNGNDSSRKRNLYTAKKIVDTVQFDLINERDYRTKLSTTFGQDCGSIFKACLVTNYFSSRVDWFSADYGDEYDHLYGFSEERRFVFNGSNLDSSVIFTYQHAQIEAVTQNQTGKVKRNYYLYGPLTKNQPELIGYYQYDQNGNLIEAYSLNCVGWSKTTYEYDGKFVKRLNRFQENMDSLVQRCQRKEVRVNLYYGMFFYDDVWEFYSDTDYPPSLIYDTLSSEDYSTYSRIKFVGNSRDTITNFIVADSSDRIYTVEYW